MLTEMDLATMRTLDDDNDGVEDSEDTFPLDPTETLDADGDVGDLADLDDDNDGTLDTKTSSPLTRLRAKTTTMMDSATMRMRMMTMMGSQMPSHLIRLNHLIQTAMAWATMQTLMMTMMGSRTAKTCSQTQMRALIQMGMG